MPIDPVDELYESIRGCSTDVEEIARQTGFKPENIREVKEHLFLRMHWLDLYEEIGVPGEWGRFDSLREIAEAWQRLREGRHIPGDLQLLRHEMAEARLMRKHGPSYRDAHRMAQRRYPWHPGS